MACRRSTPQQGRARARMKPGAVDPKDLDLTDRFGPIDSKAEIPMYSYSRPAWGFWNGVAKELARQGHSMEYIEDWLKSRNARWLLDHFDREIERLGERLCRAESERGDDLR